MGLASLALVANTRQYVSSKSLQIIGFAACLVLILLVISSLINKKTEYYKKLIFGLTALIVALSTGALATLNLYLYSKSEVKGIVNWQAGIEFWVCDTEIELKTPNKLFDKHIGNSSIYENDDKKIHITGIVQNKSTDATLGAFMRAIGGSISSTALSLPVDSRIIENKNDGDTTDLGGASNVMKYISENTAGNKTINVKNGMACGNNTKSELQVFVYNAGKDLYSQEKLTNPSEHVIKPSKDIPPGECLIVEFGRPKERTDKLCKEYGERDATRCQEFGVAPSKAKDCKLREVQSQGSGL